MSEGNVVDTAAKEAMVDEFRRYLDSIDGAPGAEPADAEGAETDLFTLFVELAATRNEVRTESRLVKDALDQFRTVFATLQSSQATLEQELKRAHADARTNERSALRPMLLDLLDLRDRLTAGLQQPEPTPRWIDRLCQRRSAQGATLRDGLAITLRRLERMLADRRVIKIEAIDRRFDPRLARAVGTAHNPAVGDGVVVEEFRAGFTWDDELLRTAEVIVNTNGANSEEK